MLIHLLGYLAGNIQSPELSFCYRICLRECLNILNSNLIFVLKNLFLYRSYFLTTQKLKFCFFRNISLRVQYPLSYAAFKCLNSTHKGRTCECRNHSRTQDVNLLHEIGDNIKNALESSTYNILAVSKVGKHDFPGIFQLVISS